MTHFRLTLLIILLFSGISQAEPSIQGRLEVSNDVPQETRALLRKAHIAIMAADDRSMSFDDKYARGRKLIARPELDNDLRFSVDGLDKGLYYVVLSLPQVKRDAEKNLLANIAVPYWTPVKVPDQGSVAISVPIEPSITVKGRVLTHDNKPIANVAVMSAQYTNFYNSTRSREDGAFEMKGMPRNVEIELSIYHMGDPTTLKNRIYPYQLFTDVSIDSSKHEAIDIGELSFRYAIPKNISLQAQLVDQHGNLDSGIKLVPVINEKNDLRINFLFRDGKLVQSHKSLPYCKYRTLYPEIDGYQNIEFELEPDSVKSITIIKPELNRNDD